jgi:hypothetical protein
MSNSTSTKQTLLLQIDNFFNDLCNTFPNNKELNIFKEKFSLLRKANSSIIVDYFVMYVYPFKQNIISKDENFFLDGGGQGEITAEAGLKFRDNIKKLWVSDMSDENKEVVWKYFKVFILLCERYINENLAK